MARKTLSLLLILSFALSLSGCQRKKEATFYEYFDTVTTVASYAKESRGSFEKNCEFVESELEYYHKLFDIYFEYSGMNNLKTVNDNAGVSAVAVDRELIDFLVCAKETYATTAGKMNIAMGSVLSLWHDCRAEAALNPENATVPTQSELTEAAAHCDINDLIIDEKASTVYISNPKASIDVGAYAKGYATEKIAEGLIERGVSSYTLNVGGNIRVIGEKPNGDGWTTGITNPDVSSSEPFIGTVVIKNTSLVTSGGYERYFSVGDKKYHHVIDPDTLYPADYFSSVSVFHNDSGLADALSTALFCMSYEDGLSLVSSLDGVEVIWVFKDYTVRHTDGVEFHNPPAT